MLASRKKHYLLFDADEQKIHVQSINEKPTGQKLYNLVNNENGEGLKNGGGSRIRTHGARERPTVFKTAALGRSAIPPCDFGFELLFYRICDAGVKSSQQFLVLETLMTQHNLSTTVAGCLPR